MHILRHPSFSHTGHRPYPVAGGPWAMAMTWEDLLFMHWPVNPDRLRPLVPEPFELDLMQGQAWIGVVPFRMTGVRPRCLPAVPRVFGNRTASRFLELNVRTYVRIHGKPGVFFFSLDAESRLAVRMARRFFHLPYFDADMNCRLDDQGWFHYESRRTHKSCEGARMSIRYRPVQSIDPADVTPDSAEYFLTERYCLVVTDRRQRPKIGEIHHRQWPLELAETQIDSLDMTRLLGLELSGPPAFSHFARKLHVAAWLNKLA